MKEFIDKSFEKDTDKINDPQTLNSIADCIEKIKEVENLTDISNCKKLKGSKNSYIIRMGNYRIGFVYENKTIEFVRFLHRSKIYKSFSD